MCATRRLFNSLLRVQQHGIWLSMSDKGHGYDNAAAKSFFHGLKTEHTNHCNFKTREEAKLSVFEYIEVFYNRNRLHSYLGCHSPELFEELGSIGEGKTG